MTNQEEMQEQAHHARGMSKWPALFACQCFESVESSDNTEKGTACHKVLEDALKSWNNNRGIPDIETARDMYEAGAIRAAKRITNDAYSFGAMAVHSEERVTLDNGVFGTADAYFMFNDVIHLYDFKTFRNGGRDYLPQLAGYALAIAQREELTGEEYRNKTIVNYCVLYGDTSDVCEGTLTGAELEKYFTQAMAIFDHPQDKPTQCNWCNLCSKMATCKACVKVVTTAKTTVAEVTQPEKWELLDQNKKAQLLVLAEFAAQWSDGVKDLAKADLIAGKTINDEALGVAYKLQTVKGRQTPDMAKACTMLQAKGVQRADITTKLKFSVSDMKTLLAGAGVKGKEAAALIEEVCTRGADTVKMVKE